jgi:hypothetical protein
MCAILLGLILLAGQPMGLRPKPVVHLQPNQSTIKVEFGGSLLELINAPPQVRLPVLPPKSDAQGIPWTIDVKNLGPSPVSVANSGTHFDTLIAVGRTVTIQSTGSQYRIKH